MDAPVRIRRVVLHALAAAGIAASVHATTLALASDGRLVDRADLVVSGRVLETRGVERGPRIWTETTIAVSGHLKGTSPLVITVREPGGEVPGRATIVFGSPSFSAGERVLVFLARSSDGSYRTLDLAAGKFSEATDARGARFWHRDLRASGLRLLGSAEEAAATQRVADLFERFIRQPAPGASYMAPFAGDGEAGALFATAQKGRVHRWFAFDEGKPASWVTVGRQDGYAGAGVQELAAALAAWNGCPGARIAYALGGASPLPPSPASFNAVNEVRFDDPLDEIPGGWNGRDGIVAVGRYEAVAPARPWTSRFDGGAGFPAATHDAWTIVEADVVVQNGVSPLKGIGSATFAEILAHEIGHTLGLGHAADPRALMYASLQRLGPYLRDDDRLAAQWLYPGNQAAEASTLLPPSNLTASTGSDGAVRLQWTDNAADETFQTVYMRPAGGAFARLRDVAAGVTVANVTGLTAGKAYSFHVTARTPNRESSPSNEVEATPPRPDIQAAFTVGPPAGTAGITTFSFYDQSRGVITSREWTFGDGASSARANPTHLYREPGTWEVRLRVRDDQGRESIVARSVVVAPLPLLAPDFGWTPGSIAAGAPVKFVDRSSGVPTRWSWTFGDGTSSTERDPVKTFDAPGRYAVTMEVGSGPSTAVVTREVDVIAKSALEHRSASSVDGEAPRVDAPAGKLARSH